MEFTNKLRALGDKVTRLKDSIQTEEATKTAFIMPFIAALDYDVFDPLEVIPEFVADLGIKKGEKIDYCILQDSKPIIIIECKHWRENPNDHDNQLHRYFYATSAKFAILTNGIRYRFYTDSEQTNKMDDKPFWEFEISNLSDRDIRELENYRKSNFNVGQIFSTALDLKISNQVRHVMKKELNDPSDNFVKFFARQIHSGTLTKRIIEQYKGIIKKSLNQLISDPMQVKSATEVHRPVKETEDFNGKNPVMVEAGRKAAQTRKMTKINEFTIGSDSYPIAKSYEILTKTAEWLINNGNLRETNCPIATGRKRNLVHTTPRHRDDEDFVAPKILSNGLYIETHFSTTGCIKNARKLLESCGHQGQLLKV
ncbi:MAG: type I restriction enzyme HsdR N-terminal domain-containing protein [Bacteroidetes bacterium]|nr:type I restriction enzyme HsdR N-terminal domain-containing protein [Bacteroidota bacterium]MBL7105161.1 type I restriction enzyme HsdR N-terminal domain-containing protein [Bacteroidales bacterium]